MLTLFLWFSNVAVSVPSSLSTCSRPSLQPARHTRIRRSLGEREGEEGEREGRRISGHGCVDRDSYYLLYSRYTVGMCNNFNMIW